jgi:hypothetical protein
MKNQFSKEFIRMQKLAGIITENTINEGLFDMFHKKEITATDKETEQRLVDLANSERYLVSINKPSDPDNTDKVTYTNLSDTSIKDDFTQYYPSMKDFLVKNNNEVTLDDTYNNKKFNFKLEGDTLIATRL